MKFYWLILGIFIGRMTACSASDQQKAKSAIERAGQDLDKVCAERAALKDASSD